jgi:hypothetical protein
MIYEIDKDFYCSATEKKGQCIQSGYRTHTNICSAKCLTCGNRHRKWPTPKQFIEEYGREFNGACYYLCCYGKDELFWDTDCQQGYPLPSRFEVCACTPFGYPPNDWRPE